jgi:hypothetical protein
MKFTLLLTLAGLAIGFSAQAPAQEKNTVDSQVRQQIEALNQKFDEAFNQNDAEAVADLFTAGAIEAGSDEAAACGGCWMNPNSFPRAAVLLSGVLPPRPPLCHDARPPWVAPHNATCQ